MASSYPRILYDNKLTLTNIIASSEANGFVKENVLGWKDYTYWKANDTGVQTLSCITTGDNTTYNCVALAGHNLNGVPLVISTSVDGIVWTPIANFTPAAGPSCTFFTSVSTEYIRLEIPLVSEAASIGILFLGTYMEIPQLPSSGFNPDQKEVVIKDAVSDSGRLLGRTKKYVRKEMNLTFEYLSRSWCDSTYIPFWDAHSDKPFFFIWNYGEYPARIDLVRFPNPVLNLPYDNTFRTLSLSIEGLGY